MSALLALADFWELIVGALGVLAAVFFRYRAKRASERAATAERSAATHKEMRDHERNASQSSDADLVDRLTRRP